MEDLLEDNELKETKVLKKLKIIIFGSEVFNVIEKLMISISSLIALIFLFWHSISYYAIKFRDLILTEKKINVEALILKRGEALGFEPTVFLNKLIHFHMFSSLLWLIFMLSVLCMFRRIKLFFWIQIIAILLYYCLLLYQLGSTYYWEDTTTFDKISVFLVLINSFFFKVLIQKKVKDGNFFA